MTHTFACWRFAVWTRRLEVRRDHLWVVESEMAHNGESAATKEWLAVESWLNRALVKRAKWRRRACGNCRSRVGRSKA